MSQSLRRILIGSSFLALPLAALAQQQTVPGYLAVIIGIINGYIVPLIIALAVVYFLWGVAEYILSAGDEEKKTDGRKKMIYGVIAIAVMLSVFGLVRVLQNTFGLQGGSVGVGDLPHVPLGNP